MTYRSQDVGPRRLSPRLRRRRVPLWQDFHLHHEDDRAGSILFRRQAGVTGGGAPPLLKRARGSSNPARQGCAPRDLRLDQAAQLEPTSLRRVGRALAARGVAGRGSYGHRRSRDNLRLRKGPPPTPAILRTSESLFSPGEAYLVGVWGQNRMNDLTVSTPSAPAPVDPQFAPESPGVSSPTIVPSSFALAIVALLLAVHYANSALDLRTVKLFQDEPDRGLGRCRLAFRPRPPASRSASIRAGREHKA